MRPTKYVDVFSAEPTKGNPVAVVLEADGLSDEQMGQFAQWTNLSETTFVLRPTDPRADYLLRIWTPGGELPFAGHPTLGSAHAWLEAGGTPKDPDSIVQQCGAGLIDVRRENDRLSFAAPPLTKSGPPDSQTLAQALRALRLTEADVLDATWLVNGPPWLGLLLTDPETVLATTPDFTALGELEIGIAGLYPTASEPALEVRAFCPILGVAEDPVTGSLNAGLAQWLIGTNRLPKQYVAAQGSALNRNGRVYVHDDGTDIWVGGHTRTLINGSVDLD